MHQNNQKIMTLLKVFDYIVNNLSYHDMSNFDYNSEIHIHKYDISEDVSIIIFLRIIYYCIEIFIKGKKKFIWISNVKDVLEKCFYQSDCDNNRFLNHYFFSRQKINDGFVDYAIF